MSSHHMTISEIKSANAANGGHYFERSTMRFFRSKIRPTIYQGPGGIYFVTSEQFIGSTGIAHPRRFTVRQFNPETADIRTVGPFNTITTGREAGRIARRLADGTAD